MNYLRILIISLCSVLFTTCCVSVRTAVNSRQGEVLVTSIGNRHHWRREDLPITVYVDPAFTEAQRREIMLAFIVWSTKMFSGTELLFSFEEFHGHLPADKFIFITLQDGLPVLNEDGIDRTRLGHTESQVNILSGEILYSVIVINSEFDDAGFVHFVTLHELGHVFGLGHNLDCESIMYWLPLESSFEITEEDINTAEEGIR